MALPALRTRPPRATDCGRSRSIRHGRGPISTRHTFSRGITKGGCQRAWTSKLDANWTRQQGQVPLPHDGPCRFGRGARPARLRHVPGAKASSPLVPARPREPGRRAQKERRPVPRCPRLARGEGIIPLGGESARRCLPRNRGRLCARRSKHHRPRRRRLRTGLRCAGTCGLRPRRPPVPSRGARRCRRTRVRKLPLRARGAARTHRRRPCLSRRPSRRSSSTRRSGHPRRPGRHSACAPSARPRRRTRTHQSCLP